ncbi:hypothetical protein [Ancylomarina sp. 16SWW S1-10-2]|uniref:hypothetical protein n=1 Tax=Ancylomarina sp. 16SWW S1-10-2 TaxID=2499681 RepID=UPI0012ADE5AC|nr:hypothetical protein [Ancylomarina sp. 16SWW S1-10-2]MRT94525.1 hypothetical protein [Ancylomarina sp. 16SWW S1-10-2]
MKILPHNDPLIYSKNMPMGFGIGLITTVAELVRLTSQEPLVALKLIVLSPITKLIVGMVMLISPPLPVTELPI